MRREDKVVVSGTGKKPVAVSSQGKKRGSQDYRFPDDSMLTVMAEAFHNPGASGIITRYVSRQPPR